MPLEKVRNPAKSFVQAAEELLAIVETPLEPHLDAEPIVDVHVHEDTSGGPDDALGLYLKQMGAIPLLNRSQELVLAGDAAGSESDDRRLQPVEDREYRA